MKLRKLICVAMCISIALAISGCGNDAATQAHSTCKQSAVESVLQEGISQAEEKTESPAPAQTLSTPVQTATTPNAANEAAQEKVDVDLTRMTATMVYSEVYNMMYYPERYIGKTVLMEGTFAVYHAENAGKYYFACVIQDATACCAQGIEFVLAGDCSYPEDYPQIGAWISVSGVFETYMEGDYMYCTLKDAKLAEL